MVKRKAAISIDEWLSRATVNPADSHLTATTSTEGLAAANRFPSEVVGPTLTGEPGVNPTVTGGPGVNPTVTGSPVPTVAEDRSRQREDNSEWFWVLLEHARYERW